MCNPQNILSAFLGRKSRVALFLSTMREPGKKEVVYKEEKEILLETKYVATFITDF